MIPDSEETIVAIGSAKGAADRGIIRLAGPDALAIVGKLVDQPIHVTRATRLQSIELSFEFAKTEQSLKVDLCVWPDERSYTQQPAVEIHTIGSLPILEAIERSLVNAGARLAAPGEFTLRAFIAGRIDLTQAEAVLAVIDAQHDQLLEIALRQLAGGLSGPLSQLREDLLTLLADLEAGLDFVEEEDVQFVEQDDLLSRLANAQKLVAEAESKTESRSTATSMPLVLLTGEPNVGKSRLFNALVNEFGIEEQIPQAIVADQPGVTRDSLQAVLSVDGFTFLLADSAGVDVAGGSIDQIDAISQERVTELRNQSDLKLVCIPAPKFDEQTHKLHSEDSFFVLTMQDLMQGESYLHPPKVLATSAATGAGIESLVRFISEHLSATTQATASDVVADTANRCRESLAEAQQALGRAVELAKLQAGDELVSHELRVALESLGRVVGAVVTDDVLDQIFSKFCIGK